MLDRNGIAQRIAQELQHNWYVNLGIGIPTLIANYIPEGIDVEFQSENGILGMGPFPFEGEEDADLIPGRMVKGMGGAMDLVASAENIIVAMMHTNRKGQSKLLKACTLPLTGVACVKKVVTNLAVLDITPAGFKLVERAPGVSVEEIVAATEGKLIVEGDIPEMQL